MDSDINATADFRQLAPIWASQRVLLGPTPDDPHGSIDIRRLTNELPGVAAHGFSYSHARSAPGFDLLVDPDSLETNPSYRHELLSFLIQNYTHLVLSSGDPMIAHVGAALSTADANLADTPALRVIVDAEYQRSQLSDTDLIGRLLGINPASPQPTQRKPPAASRGKIAMIVDNDVVRDSRVQKQARSAADRGWDVILLGIHRNPGQQRTRWRIGNARVKLLLKTTHLAPPRRQRSPAPLSSVLAFPTPRAEKHAVALNNARRLSLEYDRALAASGEADRGGLMTHPAVVPMRRLMFAMQRGITQRRVAAGERLAQSKEGGSFVTRLRTTFWTSMMGDRSWRRLDPALHEWDLVFRDELAHQRPDIIHANDFRMLGVGARAKVRAAAEGRTVRLVWDAHEYLPGLKDDAVPSPKDRALWAYEREHIPFADRVITVSETLADLLVRDHGLAQRPYIVENAPSLEQDLDEAFDRELRSDCGVGSDTPLLVYCGVAIAERGLETIVRGLTSMPAVHAAFVVSDVESPFVRSMRELSRLLGVADRLHTVTYVPVDRIVSYLSSADVGVVAAHHLPNNEISLPTKFREYSHAHLPLVVSDVKTVSEIVRRYGIGEVFVAGDVDSYVAAVGKVLADKQSYRWRLNHPGLLESWTWEASARVLESVYSSLEGETSETTRRP
jgi:glycogen synthase